MNDMMNYAIHRACRKFGGRDGTFNLACFSQAMRCITGVKHLMDGETVTALLVGRADVQPLPGGSHYKRVTHATPDYGGA